MPFCFLVSDYCSPPTASGRHPNQNSLTPSSLWKSPSQLNRLTNPSKPFPTALVHRTCGTDITSSCGTTTYGYDALSRKKSETYPDGSVLTTAYCGPSTLVTDPTNRWRRSRIDGLGRLVEIDEPNSPTAAVASTGCPGTGEPIWVTTYGYDTLGNLTSVLQNGSHSRSFSFDSFSRLLSSTNPEVGAITYAYWPDGPVHTKTDARSITTTYLYDALHRETSRTYSNSDPTVTTVYDSTNCLGLTACQNIGHRTSMADAAGTDSWAYQVDKINFPNTPNIHMEQRTTNSITKPSKYFANFAGNVAQIVYPTGRIVNYTYDAANRPATAADSANGITYAAAQSSPPTGCLSSGVCYTPEGTDYSSAIGKTATFNGVNFSETFNNRLQPLEIRASSTGGNAIDITYSFVDPVTSKNAGHVYGITNNLDTTRSQTFTYDQLNRITSALTTSTHATSPTHCWGETYTLDAWANLNSIAATTNSNYTGCTVESGFSTTADANNHLPIFGYDASGNAGTDGVVTNYVWDAESQLKSAAGVTYTYDGDGRRVSKVGSKLYWYGSGGDILAETNTSGTLTAEYIFFGGKRIAMIPAGGNPIYYVEDMLGTSRVITTNTGVVCYDADFYPYGGERTPYTNNCPTTNNYKFEGKERDTETGNDDFGARYYSNRFGRWLSADWSAVPAPIPYANLTNPQTLNLYSMVADDPESFADLDGHTYRQAYTVANPAASSAWDPGGVVNDMTNDSGLTDVEVGSLNGFRAAQAAQQNQDPAKTFATQVPRRDDLIAVRSSTQVKSGGLLYDIVADVDYTIVEAATMKTQVNPEPNQLREQVHPGGDPSINKEVIYNTGQPQQSKTLTDQVAITHGQMQKTYVLMQQIVVGGKAVQIFDLRKGGKLINGRWVNTQAVIQQRFFYQGREWKPGNTY